MTENAKIAAAYVRVSTEDQAEYSPDAQLVEIRKYAATHGYFLPDSHVYLDEGISGKSTGKRPEFNRMIADAKRNPKPFVAILLWKYSRFARNREDSIVYKSMLRHQLGIEVISISEPLSDDKISILMEAMIEAMDEYYSMNLAEEVKRGMTEKARRGELQSAPAFGYGVRAGVLIPVPEEAQLVRTIFHRFVCGEGLYPIAKWLNDMGAVTHRGGRFENRTVEYILRNPVYIGKLRWNPAGHTRRDFQNKHIILAQARHEPLVTQEIWDAAQRRLDEVKNQCKRHGRPVTQHKRWLSGLVRCADCGSTLVFTKPHYWKCNGYAHGSCPSSQHVSEERLREMFLAILRRDEDTDKPISCRAIRHPIQAPDMVTVLLDQQKQLTTKLSRLREAYLAGAEDVSSYRSAKAALEAQAEALRARIAAAGHNTQAGGMAPIEAGGHLRCISVLKDHDLDMETKHRTAHDLVEKCQYDKYSNTLRVFYRLHLPE